MSLPGNARRPGHCDDGTPVPFVAGAPGPDSPDLLQARTIADVARHGVTMGAVDQAEGQQGDPGDHGNPQTFATFTSIADLVNATALGDDTALESLPGRVRPSSWDGEPGWLAAIGPGDL